MEACWFAEREAADDRLQAMLGFPADVVLVGSLSVLARHGAESVTGAALECASVLAQAMANRQGVVPSSILLEL